MKVLFHQASKSSGANKALDTLCTLVSDKQMHVTWDTQAFIDALLKYRIQTPIVVIQVSDGADVAEIKKLEDILDGLYLIVVVKSNNEGLFTSCRQLYPRLLTHIEEDFGVIAAVIEKRLAMSGQVASSQQGHQFN